MSAAYLSEVEAPSRAEVDAWSGWVVLEFGTDWCGHCRAAQPALAKVLPEQPQWQHLKVEDGPGRALGRSRRPAGAGRAGSRCLAVLLQGLEQLGGRAEAERRVRHAHGLEQARQHGGVVERTAGCDDRCAGDDAASVRFQDSIGDAAREPEVVRRHHQTLHAFGLCPGISIKRALGVYREASRLSGVEIRGVQMHIGSQLTEVKPFELAVKKVLPLVARLAEKYTFEFFSIGGGLGIVYADEKPPSIADCPPPWICRIAGSPRAPLGKA